MMLIVEILLIVNRYKMENLKTKWKLPGKTKNHRSQQEIGCEEIENILKTAGFILFFLKKLPSPLPQFRILREDEAIKMSNRLKMVGHLYKKQPEDWLAKSPIFGDTTKKTVTSFSSQSYGGDGQIWTAEWGFCRPLPYHLATSP